MQNKKITTVEYAYTVIYEPIKEGGYQVLVPSLQGLITYGRDFEEAKKMTKDAIKCYLEGLQKDKQKIPIEKSVIQERILVTLPA